MPAGAGPATVLIRGRVQIVAKSRTFLRVACKAGDRQRSDDDRIGDDGSSARAVVGPIRSREEAVGPPVVAWAGSVLAHQSLDADGAHRPADVRCEEGVPCVLGGSGL